jgi:GDPmannose 4,6-dehydratase
MRGKEFVTRKITAHFARMAHGGTTDPVELGNLSARRDWGFSGDYVEGMWRMLQRDKGDAYVLATGEMHTIREFCEAAGTACGFGIEWSGQAESEVGTDKKTGRIAVRVNPKFYRPAEVEQLLGDASKAREELGWEPRVTFSEQAKMMIDADIERAEKGML